MLYTVPPAIIAFIMRPHNGETNNRGLLVSDGDELQPFHYIANVMYGSCISFMNTGTFNYVNVIDAIFIFL